MIAPLQSEEYEASKSLLLHDNSFPPQLFNADSARSNSKQVGAWPSLQLLNAESDNSKFMQAGNFLTNSSLVHHSRSGSTSTHVINSLAPSDTHCRSNSLASVPVSQTSSSQLVETVSLSVDPMLQHRNLMHASTIGAFALSIISNAPVPSSQLSSHTSEALLASSNTCPAVSHDSAPNSMHFVPSHQLLNAGSSVSNTHRSQLLCPYDPSSTFDDFDFYECLDHHLQNDDLDCSFNELGPESCGN